MKFAFEYAMAAQNRREELLDRALKNVIKFTEELLLEAVEHGQIGVQIDFYKTEFAGEYIHLAPTLMGRIIEYFEMYGFIIKPIDSLSFIIIYDPDLWENE